MSTTTPTIATEDFDDVADGAYMIVCSFLIFTMATGKILMGFGVSLIVQFFMKLVRKS